MALSLEKATDQAIQLYKSGGKYSDIAAELKKSGYISQRTRRPIKAGTVRLMVEKYLKDHPEVQNELRGIESPANEGNVAPAPTPPAKSKTNGGGRKGAKGGQEAVPEASGSAAQINLVKRILDIEDIGADQQIKLLRSVVAS